MMDKNKQVQLEQKGWRVGSVKEFLNLSEQEEKLVNEMVKRGHSEQAAESVITGLRQSAEGVTKDLGDFTQYLEVED